MVTKKSPVPRQPKTATAPRAASPAPPKARAAKARRNSAPAEPAREPTHDQISEAAYHRYLQRGGGHGLEFDDWIEAERELKTKKRRG